MALWGNKLLNHCRQTNVFHFQKKLKLNFYLINMAFCSLLIWGYKKMHMKLSLVWLFIWIFKTMMRWPPLWKCICAGTILPLGSCLLLIIAAHMLLIYHPWHLPPSNNLLTLAFNNILRDFLGGPVVKTLPSNAGLAGGEGGGGDKGVLWVWALVGELRSHMPHGQMTET